MSRISIKWYSYQSILAFALTACVAKSPESKRNFPAIAIIAALSVQYSNLGIKTFQLSIFFFV